MARQAPDGSERDVTSLDDQARPTFRIDPRSAYGINLSLRDPTGLSAALSDMDWDLILTSEVEDFRKGRHAPAAYRPRDARSDQVCRVAGENKTDVNAGLLGPACQMKGDRRLRRVVCSPGCRDRQHLLPGSPLLSCRRSHGNRGRARLGPESRPRAVGHPA